MITVDGNLADWTAADRLDGGVLAGYQVYGRYVGGATPSFVFALTSTIGPIGAGTTLWLDTDQNAATGYQVFGNSVGAEYNINFFTDGRPFLYTGADGQNVVTGPLQFATSADLRTVEVAVPVSFLQGGPSGLKLSLDINNTIFLPTDFTTQSGVLVTNVAPVISGPATLAASHENEIRIITKAELLANASDLNDDTLSVSGLTASAGSVVENSNGTWSYTPRANDSTGVTFSYTVSDGKAGPVAASATLDLLPVVGITIDGSIAEWTSADRFDGGVAPGYEGYARYVGGATPTYVIALRSTTGQIGAGTTLWLDTDQNRATGYQVFGNSVGAEYNVNFFTDNAPYLYTGADGQTFVSGPLQYAYSADRQTVEVSINAASLQGAPSSLRLSLDINNTVFLPVDFTTQRGFLIGNTAASVSGPVVLGALTEGTSRVITAAQLLANAADIDGDSLFVANVAASSGTLTNNGNGTWNFTPAANDTSSVTFSYTVGDGKAAPVAATATLDLIPVVVNAAPVVTGPVALAPLNEDASRTITAAQLLANASDANGDALTIVNLTASSGTLTSTGTGTWSFTPVTNDDTGVTFSYGVSDGKAAAVAASATLDLVPVNDAPSIAGPVTLAALNEDTTRTITAAQLLSRATDVDGDVLSVSNLTASSGSLTSTGAGTWLFTPRANDDTSVTFAYSVSDGKAVAVATSATLDLIPVNDGPTSTADSAAVSEDSVLRATGNVLTNDRDIDGGTLRVVGVNSTSGNVGATLAGVYGTLQLNADGSYTYALANNSTAVQLLSGGQVVTDTFSYTISDGQGGTTSSSLSVKVTGASDNVLIGNDYGNSLYGSYYGDVIVGLGGNDYLYGNSRADYIDGGTGNDYISGGDGLDVLRGGTGNDAFVYSRQSESGPSATQRDLIVDFQQGFDKINVSGIDANQSGWLSYWFNESFGFVGELTGSNVVNGVGQLSTGKIGYHFETIGGVVHTIVEGNVDSGRGADFQIAIAGQIRFTASDFVL